MSRTLPANGTYLAKLAACMAVFASKAGNLCVAIPVRLLNADVAWSGRDSVVIGKGETGELDLKRIDDLKTIFPDWDGTDPFKLEAIRPKPGDDAEFEIVGEQQEFTPTGKTEPVLVFKIKWINPLGGAAGMPKAMDAAERKDVLTKWGSKFRAVAGKPAAKAAPSATAETNATTATAAPGKAASGGPPSRRKAGSPAVGNQPRTMTQDEAWAAFAALPANEGGDEAAMGDAFWNAHDEMFPDKDPAKRVPADWGKVADKLGC